MSRAAAFKDGYTRGARTLASRSVTGLARTRITPNALTTTGVLLCGLDSTPDRVSEGFMLTAIAYVLARHHHPIFVAVAMAAVAGSFLVSYTRAKAEALGLRGDVGIGSRAERVVVITAGLVFAPWGVLPWALVVLSATAWITVCQRVLHVRSQLLKGGR